MNVLGVDPGIKNTGLYYFGSGKSRRATVKCPRAWSFERCVEKIAVEVQAWVASADVVAVEEVVWRRRRGMLPLAHVAGLAVGIALGLEKVVYLLTPAQKGNVGKTPKGWTPHEVDARALARVAYHAESVPSAVTDSIRRRRLTLSAAALVPSVTSKNGKGGNNGQ